MSDVLCRCPACAAKFKVDAKYSGKKARCPKCSVVVEVPAAGADSLSSTAAGGSGSVSGNTTIIPVATTPVPPKAVALSSSTIAPVASPITAAHSTKTTPIARPIQSRAVAPPPPREQALEATVEDVVPAQINDTPPQETFGFQLNTSKSKSSGGMSASTVSGPVITPAPHDDQAEPAHRGRKAASSNMPLILAGVGGLVLLVGLGIGAAVMMSNSGSAVAKNNGSKKGSGNGATKVASAKGTGKLVLEWSEDDRKTAFEVRIDGKKELALPKGELSFDLKPGEHKVLMRRTGFEPVETTVTITAGGSANYKPEWKKNEFNSTGPTIAAKPTPGSGDTGTNFQVGMAAGSPVKGFDGFTQNFHAATEGALKAQKNVLIIFASSDSDAESMQIARSTQDQATRDQIQSSFIPVIIDFPRTREGYNNLYDSAQNKGLAEDFNLRKLPTLVLLDHKGKTYYQQSDWKNGTTDLKKYLEEGATARTERDELWAAVKGETLDPAVKFVSWLLDRKLVVRYKDEVKQWIVVAQKLDAQNEKGQLECFVEADRMVAAVGVNPDDEIGINAFVAPLQDWLTNKRFKDEDRGARMHLMAGGLLAHADRRDDAMKHFARAGTYNPKDAKLKEAVARAKSAAENGNILGFGTGFVISESGYLMTNRHVIDGKGKVMVRLPDNKTTVEGKVIAKGDDDRDMALVKIEVPAGVTLKPVAVLPTNIGRGTNVAAFGYPKAESVKSSLKFTAGGVSALPDDSNDNMILLDLTVNPGNSGGPLVDQKGNVVGMVTAKTITNMFTQEDSYGMAIPSADIVKFLDKYLPADAKRAAASAATSKQEWSDIDSQVSPGVLLIMKTE